VQDMLRLSDGRMSGTAGGTIVLHISPESADPESVLGIVKTGDEIMCDVERRMLQLNVPNDEVKRRIKSRKTEPEVVGKAAQQHTRGYRGLYMRTVNQANEGADFDFLTAAGPS
jgi:dihydroxy-acid dehydratase